MQPVIENTPGVTDQAAPAIEPSQPTAPKPAEFGPDKLGRAWDAEKFRLKDGKPQLDAVGRFVPARGGRSRKDGTPNKAEKPAPGAVPSFDDVEKIARETVEEKGPTTIEELEEEENYTSDTIIGAIQTALVYIGDDEGVLSETEKKILRRPLLRVLQKYSISAAALPPEADLAFAVAAIVISRLQRPKTATFFAKCRYVVSEWWARRKGNELARSVRNAVQAVSTDE
jgi:hypothetical protein